MSKVIELPLAPEYVSHWGFWEGIREILQNAIDQEWTDPTAEMIFNQSHSHIAVTNKNTTLSVGTLLLGRSGKADGQIGGFGEGYKLALLVLLRNNYRTTIRTGDQVWTPSFGYSKTFDGNVLRIDIEDGMDWTADTTFLVECTGEEERNIIAERYIHGTVEKSHIIRARPGDVFVGGLYVCHFNELKFGYNFVPGEIILNRDRNSVELFELQWKLKDLLREDIDGAELLDMVIKSTPDVEYVTTPTKLALAWIDRYDEVIPVGSQEDLIPGKECKIVPKKLADMIQVALGYLVPSKRTVKQRVDEFFKTRETLEQSYGAEIRQLVADCLKCPVDTLF